MHFFFIIIIIITITEKKEKNLIFTLLYIVLPTALNQAPLLAKWQPDCVKLYIHQSGTLTTELDYPALRLDVIRVLATLVSSNQLDKQTLKILNQH